MSWTPAPADIYERIRAALFANKGEYFHPEYPDDWLDDRLRRYLPRLPFYCTESCLLRPVVKREFIYFEQILSFGRPSPRQAISLIALAYDLCEHLAVPILAESFNPVRHRGFGKVSEQELQFPLFNADARDPWSSDLADPSDPRSLLDRTLGELPDDIEPYLSPLYGYIYFDEERSDAVEIVEAVSRVSRSLHVSSASKSLTRHLHQRFAAKQTERRFVGEPRINYITTLPDLTGLGRARERDRRKPIEKHILLEGRLHAL
jgi:hypothetical protein